MKKLVLSIAILASGVSTYAITNNVSPETSINILMNEEFTEISVEELPSAITASVQKDFPTATVSKAFVNASGQYKLELTVDGNANTIYADKEGNWLEESAVK
ncbi:hypothetical protein [Wenyingzhuangia aestuarii]|uniref:hypothetical protein n=1 Tax=Wenyingzhuangia aestuarii TaxID=1647582 RepID=UPI00143A94E8|nr:hypothetical protein [Wenyingzhuangia aestuarii]NJB84112.1 hypothetical protein [Wenyingzhuangia aestuarii]